MSGRTSATIIQVLALVAVVIGSAVAGPPTASHAGALYTVNTNLDLPDLTPGDPVCDTVVPGLCSLRAAITSANILPGEDTIFFAIGTGPVTITPTAPLPAITDPLWIDGASQPGRIDVPIVEISGELLTAGDGLVAQAAGTNITGLVINRFPGNGIVLGPGDGSNVWNCYIGTNMAGTAAASNGGSGILISSSLNTIGGTSSAAKNVISGNAQDGVTVTSGASNRVAGNYIGTNAAGSAALGNGADGVVVHGSYTVVGGPTLADGNVISGNVDDGVELSGAGAFENLVTSNQIGIDSTATAAIPNGYGVYISGDAQDNSIGAREAQGGGRNRISGNTNEGVLISGAGTTLNTVQYNFIGMGAASTVLPNWIGVFIFDAPDNLIGDRFGQDGNLIAGNTGPGIIVLGDSATGNTIARNSTYDNGTLGIDLGFDGVTANTPGGPHTGPNNLQNFPVLSGALRDYGSTTVDFTLNGTPNSEFTIEFFATPDCDPAGYGEGQTYIGDASALTDGNGITPAYAATFPTVVPAGHFITATATDAAGNTSEFSACRQVMPIQCVPGDSDCDGYLDSEETALGTNTIVYCPIMRADVNHDQAVNLLDLAKTALYFGQQILPAFPNYDQGPPDYFDYVVNLLDLAKEAQQFGKHVTDWECKM